MKHSFPRIARVIINMISIKHLFSKFNIVYDSDRHVDWIIIYSKYKYKNKYQTATCYSLFQ